MTCQKFFVGVPEMNLVINGLAYHQPAVTASGLVEGEINWRSKIKLFIGIHVPYIWQGIKIYFFW